MTVRIDADEIHSVMAFAVALRRATSSISKVFLKPWKNPPRRNYGALPHFPMANLNVRGTFPPSDMFIFIVVSIGSYYGTGKLLCNQHTGPP